MLSLAHVIMHIAFFQSGASQIAMNLSEFTLPQLQQFRTKIAKEIDKRQAGTKTDLLKRLTKMAKKHGLSLSDVVGASTPTEAKAKKTDAKPAAGPKELLPAKYRHPNNKDLAWSGRGRRPQWVEQWLANGGALAALEVAAQKMGRKGLRTAKPAAAAAPVAEAPAVRPEQPAETTE